MHGLDSVGYVIIEACTGKLRILFSSLVVRHVKYKGITSSIIFEIIIFGCCVKQKLKLTLCSLRSSRTNVYGQFGTWMINLEVVIASFVAFKSRSFSASWISTAGPDVTALVSKCKGCVPALLEAFPLGFRGLPRFGLDEESPSAAKSILSKTHYQRLHHHPD